MDKVRFGIIGYGNMGTSHVRNLQEGKVKNAVVTAVCDFKEERQKKVREDYPELTVFSDYKELLNSGLIDAVIIATYHYSHPQIAIDAFAAGLNVLTEKPAGVYTKAVEQMNEAAKSSGKKFGIMYNQRTNPVFAKVRKLVKDGEVGELKRASWTITDWYRAQAYHDSSSWRSTWKDEGGGVLINQCPHNIDLFQWILGMPEKVTAKMSFGKYYDIEVEDDVTAFFEYKNGATATFITTTGEAPGTNRLEIAGTKGRIIVENRESIVFDRLIQDEREFNSQKTEDVFARPESWRCEIPATGTETAHCGIIENFAASILSGDALLAPGEEGILGLTLSNAMHLSAWTNETVTLPIDADKFKSMLDEKISSSTYVKKVHEVVADVRGSH